MKISEEAIAQVLPVAGLSILNKCTAARTAPLEITTVRPFLTSKLCETRISVITKLNAFPHWLQLFIVLVSFELRSVM